MNTQISVNNNAQNLDVLLQEFSDNLQKDVSLAKYNTWRVGGKADYVFKPRNLSDLQNFLKALSHHAFKPNILWLGLGSNVLIRDGGYRGVIVLTNSGKDSGLNSLELRDNNVIVGAGVPCAKFAKFLADNNYPAGAFWAGIPGTMGGALAMNAGCYGHETWEYVKGVTMMSRDGEMLNLTTNDFNISYRHTELRDPELKTKELWFTSASLSLPHNEELCGRQEIKQLLKKRNDSQPIGLFSGGSVFKNPEGNYSARLIEEAGLKGYQIGGAMVSSKHANFIVSDKTATAENIEQLMLQVQKQVAERFNINLEPEVKIIGEHL